MKALVVETPGDAPVLKIVDRPVPDIGPDDVLVEVSACGLCHHDVAVMHGVLRRGVVPGVVLGHEISGRVAQAGESVRGLAPGDPVVAALTIFCGRCERCLAGRQYRCLEGQGIGHAVDGGFAEFVRLPATSVIRAPERTDLVEASILACPIAVTLQALADVAKVQDGETVLVTGAGGGLGVHAVQVAASMGARVLAVTGSPDKVAALEQAAPCEVILAGEFDFAEIVHALTEDQGADVVLDTVGSAVFRSALRSLRSFGRMVLLGEVAGEPVRFSLAEILFRDATVRGSTGANPARIADAAERVASGTLKPIVSGRFSLEEAAEAAALVRARETLGRVVIVPR